jgi:hypothetical protein
MLENYLFHLVPALLIYNAISFLGFTCVCAFAYKNVKLMDGFELLHQDNLYLFVHTRTCWGSKCEVGAL